MNQQVLYHGTDLHTARLIVKQGRLYGDYPIYGAGVCTSIVPALGFATRKTGRNHTRAVLVIEPRQPFILSEPCLMPDNTICFSRDTEPGAYTAHDNSWNSLRYINVHARIMMAKAVRRTVIEEVPQLRRYYK